MKTKFCLLLSITLFTSSVLFPGIFFQGKKERDQKKTEQSSLIRKELLSPSKKPLPPIKRNIFTRQRMKAAGGEFSSQEDFQAPERKETPLQQKSAVEEVQIAVKYIGYVQSGEKVVALIILGGNTYAVESGDVLETGLTIGEITPEFMEIFERGSEPKKIILEGEKP